MAQRTAVIILGVSLGLVSGSLNASADSHQHRRPATYRRALGSKPPGGLPGDQRGRRCRALT